MRRRNGMLIRELRRRRANGRFIDPQRKALMNAALSELLAPAMNGDRTALERLLVSCQDRLAARIGRKLPSSLRRQISPEDVLQEVYLDVFRGFRSIEARDLAGFLRWILTITDNRLIDCVRACQAAKRGGGYEPLDADAGSSADALLDLLWATSRTPSRSAARHENVARLGEAMEQLTTDYRDAIRYRYLEGLTVGQTAARMNRSEFAVQKLCSRGLTRLRAVLGASSTFLSDG